MGNNLVCSGTSKRDKIEEKKIESNNNSNTKKSEIINRTDLNQITSNNISNNIISNSSVLNSNKETSLTNYNKKTNKKYTFNGPKSVNLIVHKNDGMNDFVIEMTLTKCDTKSISKQAEFIMILDVSGSMSSWVHNLVTNIIPRGLNLLKYADSDIPKKCKYNT